MLCRLLLFYTGSVCNNMTCSGNGQCEDGKCICNRLYSGDFCQNKGVHTSSYVCKTSGLLIDNVTSSCVFILLINFILSDECENESDCSNHGACIDIQATSFPRRQCFCDPGWFGERCSRGKFIYAKQSVICLWNFSLSCYYVSMSLCVYCTETVIKKQRHKF